MHRAIHVDSYKWVKCFGGSECLTFKHCVHWRHHGTHHQIGRVAEHWRHILCRLVGLIFDKGLHGLRWCSAETVSTIGLCLPNPQLVFFALQDCKWFVPLIDPETKLRFASNDRNFLIGGRFVGLATNDSARWQTFGNSR